MQPKLLFIDDDIDTRDVVRESLIAQGFHVVCVQTGAEAIARLEREEFEAVISDLNMPGMSGLELCRRVHRNWPNLPLLVLTGFLSTGTSVEALRAGACEVLSKPIRMQELLLALTRALAGRRVERKHTPRRATPAHEPNPSPRS